MPNPKRRHSQQRGAKRRTHYKATAETWSIDKTTGESHLRHRAHWSENKLYYKGKLVIDNAPDAPGAAPDAESN
jgi:large subunit ribosomal protein L32